MASVTAANNCHIIRHKYMHSIKIQYLNRTCLKVEIAARRMTQPFHIDSYATLYFHVIDLSYEVWYLNCAQYYYQTTYTNDAPTKNCGEHFVRHCLEASSYSIVLESKFFKHVYLQNQMENTSQYAITNELHV